MPKVLIIDDEEKFRESLSQRLQLRGYANRTLPDGHDAIKVVRNDQEIDVVILDRRMPGLSGEETLREIKNYRPELQVIMLTGHGDTQSAVEAGRLDAYSYLIGLLLLNSSRSLPAFLFLFLPLFGMTCSFLSEHALIAFTMPVLLIVYLSSIRAAGVTEDKSLAVFLMLSVNFAANSG